jgi:hypothetical protein
MLVQAMVATLTPKLTNFLLLEDCQRTAYLTTTRSTVTSDGLCKDVRVEVRRLDTNKLNGNE